MENNIKWLENWYKNQCDSKWEHDHGITIETLDNPGWSVKIDLEGVLHDENFEAIKSQSSETEWLDCSIGLNDEWLAKGRQVKQFKGFGGANQLEEIIEVFKKVVQ